MIRIGCWHWGTAYGSEYIDRLEDGVSRNLSEPHSFHVWGAPSEDRHLTEIGGCLARLRMFDPAWQQAQGFGADDVMVCLDLDLIVTGSLNGLFDSPAGFRILQDVNTANPCRFNGSVWSLRTGFRPDVWADFSVEAASKVPHFTVPDDQSWFEHKMPDAAAFRASDGVYAFAKNGWPKGEALPADARIVAFPGHRDPRQFQHLDWVKRHWLG